MNARQKAKTYKKQLKAYENLYCKPNEIFIDRTQLEHRKFSSVIHSNDLMTVDKNEIMDSIYNKICNQLKLVVKDNLVEVIDLDNNRHIYEFDMWTLK